MLRVLFVRHGLSKNNSLANAERDTFHHPNSQYQSLRVSDPPLVESSFQAGKHAAAYIKERLQGEYGLTEEEIRSSARVKLVCSPFLRALQSAEILQEELGTKVFVDQDAHEVGGLFDPKPRADKFVHGMTGKEMLDLFPRFDIDKITLNQGWWCRAQETTHQARERAEKLLTNLMLVLANGKHPSAPAWTRDWLQDSSKDRFIIFIAHGTFLSIVLKTVLGTEDKGTLESFFLFNNWSCTELQFCIDGNGKRRIAINYVNIQHYLPKELRAAHLTGGIVSSLH